MHALLDVSSLSLVSTRLAYVLVVGLVLRLVWSTHWCFYGEVKVVVVFRSHMILILGQIMHMTGNVVDGKLFK